MTCPTRRALLVAAAFLPIAACSPAQVDAALVRIKNISTRVRTAAEDWFAAIPLAAPILVRIRENDAAIQAATTITEILKVAAGVLAGAVSDLLSLASFAPVPIPAGVLTALEAIASALRAFGLGGAATARAGGPAAATAPAPTLAEAEAIALALPRAPKR